MTTNRRPIDLASAWIITQQDSWDTDRYPPVEVDVIGDGVIVHHGYRTRAAAEAAMRAMVPEGEDPGRYGGYRVERAGRFAESLILKG